MASGLYLDTMAKSRAVNGGGGVRRSEIDSRKTDSPDLQPLPPLAKPNLRQNVEVSSSAVQEVDVEESFYSPRGSASGLESSHETRYGSRRVLASVQNEVMNESNSSHRFSSYNTSSPRRSASLSISPPVSGSTKCSKVKSPEFLNEIEDPTLEPSSPQLPPMSFLHSPPPWAAYSSPKIDFDP